MDIASECIDVDVEKKSFSSNHDLYVRLGTSKSTTVTPTRTVGFSKLTQETFKITFTANATQQC